MLRAFVWGGAGAVAIAAVAIAWQARAGDDAGSAIGVDELAVLERAPTAADRGPEVQSLLRFLRETGTTGVHENFVRLLRRSAEGTAILVPIGRIEDWESRTSDRERDDGLCLYYGDELASVTCGGLRELRAGSIGGSSGQSWTSEADGDAAIPVDGDQRAIDPSAIEAAPVGTPTHFYGLVPDGVARVVQTFSGDVPDVSAAVTQNYYEAVSTHPEASDRQAGERWYDDAGRVVGPSRAR